MVDVTTIVITFSDIGTELTINTSTKILLRIMYGLVLEKVHGVTP